MRRPFVPTRESAFSNKADGMAALAMDLRDGRQRESGSGDSMCSVVEGTGGFLEPIAIVQTGFLADFQRLRSNKISYKSIS